MRGPINAIRGRGARSALVAMIALFVLVSASHATAAINHEPLLRFGSPGSGAGQLIATWGIATDPTTGHVYVVGEGNNRVDEFTPWGGFVKAYGWDVAPGAVNEVQELRIRASSGTFKLSFGAATSANLPFDATGAEVKAALEGLPTIGGAGGSVDVVERKGASDGTVPYVYVITFKGSLAGTNVAQLEGANGTTPLAGGVPTTTLEARTRADGGPAGTGLESCTAESGCQAGIGGGGGGQMGSIFGAATDPSGNLYIRERPETNNRVQKFSPAGHFVWAIGGEVNKTKTEELGSTEAQRNLCTAGEVCQAGTSGSGKGQFQNLVSNSFGIAFAAGRLYVADGSRIQVFNEDGQYLEDLPDPGNVRAGKKVAMVAVDPARNRLYLDYRNEDNVTVLDATTGAELGQRKESYQERLRVPFELALDSAGDLFAVAAPTGEGQLHSRSTHVAEFSPSGAQLIPDAAEEEACRAQEAQAQICRALFGSPEATEKQADEANLRGLSTGPAGDLYIGYGSSVDSFIRAFGPPPLAFEAPPSAPPSLDAQYAASVSDTDATLRAEINPHFWSGSLGTTTFYMQYATADCIETEGWSGACVKEKPAPPGTVLKSAAVDADVKSAPIALEGLTPNTAYRFRFIAEGSGALGVAIVGVGGKEGVEGEDAAFHTFPSAAEEAAHEEACLANEGFRTGPSAALPDCRAYELVSPIDKEGGEVKVLPEGSSETPGALVQSAPDGNRIVYGTYASFGTAPSGTYTSQYLATRAEGEEWRSLGISPPRARTILVGSPELDTELKYLSDDLCSSWLRTFADPPLAPGAVSGYANLYRRDMCPESGGYEALTSITPPPIDPRNYVPELQGLAEGGAEAIYLANAKLTADAPPINQLPNQFNETLLYGVRKGDPGPRYLCVLPGGAPSTGACTAGGPAVFTHGKNRDVRLDNALSADGTRLYWSTASGKLYLRENPFGEGSECSGEEAPCTYAVVGKAAQFWGASPNGGTAIYSSEEKLFEFDAATKASVKVAGKVAGVAGMSKDAAAVYFVSQEDLDGAGPAHAGDRNLYLHEAVGPSTRFIAALVAKDMSSGKGFGAAAALAPSDRTSKVSPDGQTLAFMSSASPTGYDNTDLQSGEADAEVYLYRPAAAAGQGRLLCVSCNPAGTRPIGEDIANKGTSSTYWAAASLPGAESNLYEARALADEGKRLYFDSSDALVRTDTNGVGDVYQWEAAGAGGCTEADTHYVESAEGCIELISSGKSPVVSEFAEATPSGDDVFFTTLSSLLPQDPGVTDLYDARVNGGLPSPTGPAPSCEGEACQGPYVPPSDPTPASSSFRGAGNVKEQGKAKKKKHKAKKKKKRAVSHKKGRSRR